MIARMSWALGDLRLPIERLELWTLGARLAPRVAGYVLTQLSSV